MDTAERPDDRTAPAAEADVLGGDARNTGQLDKLTDDKGASGGAPRGNPSGDGSAKPGADENQAGFVKDPDKRFAP